MAVNKSIEAVIFPFFVSFRLLQEDKLMVNDNSDCI